MITPGSRYAESISVEVATADGTNRWAVYAPRIRFRKTVTYRYRTARQGDRFDLLAAREYGDPLLWWVLARANPEIFYPDEIPAGIVLRIPSAASIL